MNKISLEMGSGGKLMRDFIHEEILQNFRNPYLEELTDAAFLPPNIALTTDSYVVDPLFFPGGDIGTLCVNGTVNDLIVSGAEPRFLALSLIIEEGLEKRTLTQILHSIKEAAQEAQVLITTGDTKVVRQGQGDKIFITTSGVGEIVARPSITKIKPGDKIIVTGTLGEHSLAIMMAREEFGLEAEIKSDCAPLNFLLPLWKEGVLWMRDITRGGLASVLTELAERLPYSITIDEESIPLSLPVQGACEFLGIDPLYLACEGRAVLVVEAKVGNIIIQKIKSHPLGKTAAIIGEVATSPGRAGEVLLRTISGGWRLLEPLTSELLPRIC